MYLYTCYYTIITYYFSNNEPFLPIITVIIIIMGPFITSYY